MKIQIKTDLVSGCFFLVVSLVVLALIPSQISVLGDARITSRTFPYLLSLLIMAMSLRLIISDVVKLAKGREVKTVVFSLRTEAKGLLLFGILIAYLVLMPLIGFLTSSILMCGGFLAYFRIKKLTYYIICLASCILVFVIFRYGLNVLLP